MKRLQPELRLLMPKSLNLFLMVCMMTVLSSTNAQNGLIPVFPLRVAASSGAFEAWAYPLKLFRNFEISFFLGSSTRPIRPAEIVRYISVTPEATGLTYTYQSFTVRVIYITPVEEPGAILLLEVDTIEPLTIVCGFLPVLQPMWPAGIGGQYAYWDNELKAYVISEPTKQNHGLVGSPAALGFSGTPAHMLADSPNEFKIEIPDSGNVRGKYIPVYIAGGKGSREEVVATYRRLQNDPEKYYRQNAAHYSSLHENTLRVTTPDRELNLAFEWAKVTFDNLLVENPDLGKGLLAGLGASGSSGRPGFGWFFGGDAYINIFSLNSYGALETVRDALAFTQKWQREDGKMVHELSQAAGYIDWFKDYPYAFIHGDTTPFYIAAMYDYYQISGDLEFVRRSWDSLFRAYQWCLSTDKNGDGLMDNPAAGLAATEYGALTGIASDSYLSAVWVRATYAMKHLAQAVGEGEWSRKAGEDFQRAQKAFRTKFWDKEMLYYVHAFNDKGERVKEISPWNCVGLFWELGDPGNSRTSLQRLNTHELTTDWGIRNISVKSEYYKPLGYNYGAVWPFVTGWAAAALYRHHFSLQAYHALITSVRKTFQRALGCVDEVFSGSHNAWLEESVAQQGFSSAGAVLPLVRGLLGLEGDALKKEIHFAPQFPADWEQVNIDQYRIGNATFSVDYRREKDKILIRFQAQDAAEYILKCAPALGIGTQITGVKANGAVLKFEEREANQVVLAVFEMPVPDQETTIEINFIPTAELLPPLIETRTGDTNRGLKIISLRREQKNLRVDVEGLAGQTYKLGILNGEYILRVKGAEYQENRLMIKIPDGEPAKFLRHILTIALR
jgi:glycogen debranching enzyme